MGNIVVSQFVIRRRRDRGPGRIRGLRARRLGFKFDRGADGDKFKLDEVMASRRPAARPCDLRGLRRGVAVAEGEFADKFNAMPKYVVSTTLEDPDWNNSTVIAGDVADGVARAQGAPRAATSSSTAARSL